MTNNQSQFNFFVLSLVIDFMDVFEACTFTAVVGCVITLCAVLMMVQVEILV